MKNKTSFVTKKEAARREGVNRATKARFARRSTDTVMIVAGVGNTCGNTNTQYSTVTVTTGTSVNLCRLTILTRCAVTPCRQEVEAEVVVQSATIVLGPSPARLVGLMPRVWERPLHKA